MKLVNNIFYWIKRNPYKSAIGIALSGALFAMQFANEVYTLKKNIGGVSTSIANANSKHVEKEPADTIPEKTIKEEKLCTECEIIYQAGLKDIEQKRLTIPLTDNAYEKYISLKLLDQNMAANLLKKITEGYEGLLLSSVKAEKITSAKHFLKKIQSISPETDTKLLKKKIIEKEQLLKSEFSENFVREQANKPVITENINSTEKEKKRKFAYSVSRDWVKGVCAAVYSAYGDGGKVNIIVNSMSQIESLTGEDVYALYHCSCLYGDSGKLSAIRSLSSKLKERDLSNDHFSYIIEDLYSDSSKTSGTSMLVPFLKSN